jgi:hypothetical protein
LIRGGGIIRLIRLGWEWFLVVGSEPDQNEECGGECDGEYEQKCAVGIAGVIATMGTANALFEFVVVEAFGSERFEVAADVSSGGFGLSETFEGFFAESAEVLDLEQEAGESGVSLFAFDAGEHFSCCGELAGLHQFPNFADEIVRV